MSKVAIVTDSTAYLPPELIREYSIEVVPLHLIWGEKTYLDGVDITPKEFYERLATAKELPTTSQPSPAAFKAVYDRLLAAGYDVLSIHISSKLSGTMDSAIQAKAMLPGARIEIVDSLSTSMGMGFAVVEAARAAARGASLEECKAIAERGLRNVSVFFLVNTLEFLHRGGRIGGAAAFLGTALNLKPILELRDGRIEAIEKVRTISKATDRLLDIFAERARGKRPLRLAILHANAQEEAERLLERARQKVSVDDISEAVIVPVSPVIGTHTGPGCVGIAFMSGL